jgi:hypothetical protein
MEASCRELNGVGSRGLRAEGKWKAKVQYLIYLMIHSTDSFVNRNLLKTSMEHAANPSQRVLMPSCVPVH